MLDHLANRVAADPFFLAHSLAEFARSEGLDEVALAARLGCREEDLTMIRLCRTPRPDLAGFREDVAAVAGRFGVAFRVLAAGVRHGQGPGELCHPLLPDDLDLDAGLGRVRNKPRLGSQVKTRNESDIPLVPALAAVLRLHLAGGATVARGSTHPRPRLSSASSHDGSRPSGSPTEVPGCGWPGASGGTSARWTSHWPSSWSTNTVQLSHVAQRPDHGVMGHSSGIRRGGLAARHQREESAASWRRARSHTFRRRWGWANRPAFSSRHSARCGDGRH